MDVRKVDYGIDAPKVIWSSFLGGIMLIALGFFWLWLQWSWFIGGLFWLIGSLCVANGTYMLWSSRVGKLRQRKRLLDLMQLKGGEYVLDVG